MSGTDRKTEAAPHPDGLKNRVFTIGRQLGRELIESVSDYAFTINADFHAVRSSANRLNCDADSYVDTQSRGTLKLPVPSGVALVFKTSAASDCPAPVSSKNRTLRHVRGRKRIPLTLPMLDKCATIRASNGEQN